jgi:hypothetical protein
VALDVSEKELVMQIGTPIGSALRTRVLLFLRRCSYVAGVTTACVFLLVSLVSRGRPVTYLTFSAAQFGSRHALGLGLRLGVSPNATCCGRVGIRLLHYALLSDDPDIIRFLIAKGADVNLPSANGSTALMGAACSDRRIIVDVLINAGANVNARPSKDESPLLVPVHNGNTAIVRTLLAAGSDPRLDSAQLLQEAVREHHTDLLRILLNAGCSLNARGPRGDTALMWAARFGDVGMLRLLLQRQPDVNATDADGRTAKDWANADHATPTYRSL